MDVDFSEADINRDPYPFLEEVRASGRAVWNPPSNSWFVTSFDDVKAVFSNVADFAQDAEMFESIFNGPTMVSVDDPRHAELRSVLGAHLSRRAVAAHADLARETVNDNFDPIIERLRAGETVDLAPAFRSIPTEFVARLLRGAERRPLSVRSLGRADDRSLRAQGGPRCGRSGSEAAVRGAGDAGTVRV
jgi:cytochrome P450